LATAASSRTGTPTSGADQVGTECVDAGNAALEFRRPGVGAVGFLEAGPVLDVLHTGGEGGRGSLLRAKEAKTGTAVGADVIDQGTG